MTNPEEGKPNGAENEKSELEDSTTIDLDPHDETKTQLINGGAGGDEHPEKFTTAIKDPGASSSEGEVSFNGLGKDEVLQYANDPFWVKLRWVMFILFWIGWIAMLVTAIVIIVVAPRCPHRPDLKWYHTDNVYQIYAKSFKDSNDDGRGDFEGLKDKMDYITDDLETKALWLSSIFKADKDSSGMGVIDHKALDTDFASDAQEFRSWVKKMRKEGKKIILDLIPNQTSKKHLWFEKSAAKDDQYKDYYVWVDSQDSSSPPNNWKMVDSDSSAWTYDDNRKGWYLHQFSSEYPDLNLNNSKVVDEIKDIMEYWLDTGVSGFNIRQVEYLVENPDMTVDDNENRTQTRNYAGTLDLLEELRKVAEDYSDKPGRERLLFATVHNADRAQIEAYWGTDKNERLHIVAPYLDQLGTSCDAICVKGMIEKVISEETEEEQWLGLQVSDQNLPRIATRLSDSKDLKNRLLTTHAVQLLLPGTPFVYYGDEFGQRDGESMNGTDKHHAPMQWDNTENAGFTGKDVEPWTEISKYYKEDNVEAGTVVFKDDKTPFQAFVELTKLRTEESFQFGKTKLCTVGTDVLMFSRHASRFPFFITLINMGDEEMTVTQSDLECLETKDDASVKFHSRKKEDEGMVFDLEDNGVHLEKYDVVVLEFAADE